MQRLTAPPRDHLTDEQVRALLTAPALTVRAGCDLLAPDLTVVEDMSADLLGGRVERNLHRSPHATCSLNLSRALRWGIDLARPHLTLSDGAVEARWNLGVYALTTPSRTLREQPETYEVQGFDRLYLLDREVGDSYEVPAGTRVLDAVRQAVTDAGLAGVLLDGTAQEVTLPRVMGWPLVAEQGAPATWLRVVNDLLATINYRGVWADQDGLLRSEPYVEPSVRAVEWAFDADSPLTILGAERTVLADLWAVPNRWVFVQRNLPGDPPPEPVEGAGVYTVDNVSTGLSSQTSRGLVWPVTVEVDAASQEELRAIGDRRVAADLRSTERVEVSTGPFPGAGHADVFTYADAALGQTRRVQAVQWQMALDGSDVTWVWEVVA